jgi:hypothetical protein
VIRRTDGRTDHSEEGPVYRGADCPRPALGASGHAGGGGLPQDWGNGVVVLLLEAPVCGGGHRRAAATAAGRGREPQAQATGRRFESGQAHAARSAAKQRVKPAQKPAVAQFFRVGFRVSERRACHVARVPQSKGTRIPREQWFEVAARAEREGLRSVARHLGPSHETVRSIQWRVIAQNGLGSPFWPISAAVPLGRE